MSSLCASVTDSPCERAGEVGDKFYAILSGEVSVRQPQKMSQTMNKHELFAFVTENYLYIDKEKSQELVDDFELENPGCWEMLWRGEIPRTMLHGQKRRPASRQQFQFTHKCSLEVEDKHDEMQRVTIPLELTASRLAKNPTSNCLRLHGKSYSFVKLVEVPS